MFSYSLDAFFYRAYSVQVPYYADIQETIPVFSGRKGKFSQENASGNQYTFLAHTHAQKIENQLRRLQQPPVKPVLAA